MRKISEAAFFEQLDSIEEALIEGPVVVYSEDEEQFALISLSDLDCFMRLRKKLKTSDFEC